MKVKATILWADVKLKLSKQFDAGEVRGPGKVISDWQCSRVKYSFNSEKPSASTRREQKRPSEKGAAKPWQYQRNASTLTSINPK